MRATHKRNMNFFILKKSLLPSLAEISKTKKWLFFNLFVLFTINDTTKKSLHRAEASSKHKSSFLLYKGKPDNYILRWCLTAHKYKKCLNRCLNPKGKGWQGVDFSRCIKCFHVTSQSHCAWFIEQCLERKNKPFSETLCPSH